MRFKHRTQPSSPATENMADTSTATDERSSIYNVEPLTDAHMPGGGPTVVELVGLNRKNHYKKQGGLRLGTAVALAAAMSSLGGGLKSTPRAEAAVASDKIAQIGNTINQPEIVSPNPLSNTFQAETLAVASTFISRTTASAAQESLQGERVQLVCLSPTGVACDEASVKRAGNGMNAFVGNSGNGAAGFGIRFNTNSSDPKDLNVISVPMGATIDEIVGRGKLPATSPDSMLNYIERKVYENVDENPSTAYMAFLTGVPPFGRAATGGVDCSPGLTYGGMKNGHYVSTVYLNEYCGAGDIYESRGGFRPPDVRAVQAFIRNEGFLQRTDCESRDDGIITSPAEMFGLSSKPNDILLPLIGNIWQFATIGRAYLQRPPNSNPNCPYLGENARMNWLVNAKSSGAGVLDYYLKQADGTFTQIALDPGNRLPAGKTVQARYTPAGKEVFNGFKGDCTGEICEFRVGEVIDIEADVKKEVPAPLPTAPKPKQAAPKKPAVPKNTAVVSKKSAKEEYKLVVKTKGPDHGSFKLGKMREGEPVFSGKLRDELIYSAKTRGEVLVKLVADPGYYAKNIDGGEYPGDDPLKSKLSIDIVPVMLDGKNPLNNHPQDEVTVTWTPINQTPITK